MPRLEKSVTVNAEGRDGKLAISRPDVRLQDIIAPRIFSAMPVGVAGIFPPER